MISEQIKFLLQCPFCRGGRAVHPLLLLAIVAGIWLLARWIKSIFRKEGASYMNNVGKILVVIGLIAAVAVVIIIKQQYKADSGELSMRGRLKLLRLPRPRGRGPPRS